MAKNNVKTEKVLSPEEVDRAKNDFDAYCKELSVMRESPLFKDVEETVVRIAGYMDRSGFRLVTRPLGTPEAAKNFYKRFLADLGKRYPTLVLLNCTRFELDNHVEMLIVSRHIV